MRSIHRTVERALSATTLLGALASTACEDRLAQPIARAHPDDEAPRRGGVLQLGSFGDIRSLDPAVAADELSIMAVRLLYAGLVEYDVHATIIGDLASRWTVSADGTTYRFFLQEGVRFHDGEEVTADDVKRSMERALHPTTPSPVSSWYSPIVGYEAYTLGRREHLEGVRVEGRYVLSIQLEKADATFLAVMALTPPRPVCKSAGDRYDDAFEPCGAGPYKLASPGAWEHGRTLSLVRHGGYFRPGEPYLDGVTFSYGMNVVTERFKFERGEIDLVRELTQPDALRFLADRAWAPFTETEPDRTIAGEVMNVERPPFDNVEVRRAVAAAIDRENMVKIKPSTLRVAGHPVPPSLGDLSDAPPPDRAQHYDYEAALAHMARAGLDYDPVTGRGGFPKEIPYLVYKQGIYEYTALSLQQDLAKIGLRLSIRTTSFPTYLATVHRRGKSTLAPQGWMQDYPDPSDFLEPLFASKSINDEDASNGALYSNPRLDVLLDEARTELDPKRRRALYGQAEQIVCDDAPWAFTYSIRSFGVHQPYLRGYHAHPVWPLDLAGVWIDRALDIVARGFFSKEALGVLASSREASMPSPSLAGGASASRAGGASPSLAGGAGSKEPASARTVPR